MHANWFLDGSAKARTGTPQSRHPPVAWPRDPTLSSASVLLAAAVSGFGVLAMAVRSAVRRGATVAIVQEPVRLGLIPSCLARSSGSQVSKSSKVISDLNLIKFESIFAPSDVAVRRAATAPRTLLRGRVLPLVSLRAGLLKV